MDLREIHSIGEATRERIVTQEVCPGLSRFGIGVTGISRAVFGFHWVRLAPNLSQVLASVSGEGEALVRGEWKRAEPGTAYVTPPDQPHAYRALNHGIWEVAWVIYVNPSRSAPGASLSEPELMHADAGSLSYAIEGLYREANGAKDPRLLTHWSAIVHGLAGRVVDPPATDARLLRLWEAVRERVNEPWTLPALAKIAGMSSEHLRRLCHEELGTSPLRYLTALRMRQAATLLPLPTYTVERVAELVGYENPFAFSSAFKRVIGRSPSALRPK